jgi:hypothetical protein
MSVGLSHAMAVRWSVLTDEMLRYAVGVPLHSNKVLDDCVLQRLWGPRGDAVLRNVAEVANEVIEPLGRLEHTGVITRDSP